MINVMPDQPYQQRVMDDGIENGTGNYIALGVQAGGHVMQLLLSVEDFLVLIYFML